MKSIRFVFVMLIALLMTGCATAPSSNSSSKSNNILGGLIIGGISGKATGNHSNKRMLQGAALGGAAGWAFTGRGQSRAFDRLVKATAGTGVTVTWHNNNPMLIIPSSLVFERGSSQLRDEGQGLMEIVLRAIQKEKPNEINLFSHVDEEWAQSRRENNSNLSQNRANTFNHIFEYMRMDDLVKAHAYGNSFPLVRGRASVANTRTEIELII
jgi:flagellar motor protein MotB